MFFLRCNLILVLVTLSLGACGSNDNSTASQIDDEEMSSSETSVSSSLSEHSSSSEMSVSSSSSKGLSSSEVPGSSSSMKVSSSSSVVIPSYSYPDWANCVSDGRCGTFTDTRDGHVYKKVSIGNQTWMAENLAYLPSVNAPSDQGYNIKYYVYGYHGTVVAEAKASSTYIAYGALYNWNAAIKACPSGWHLPDTLEWSTLATYVGSNTAGTKLKSISGWLSCDWSTSVISGTDSYGFSALPGGFYSVGSELGLRETGFSYIGSWWSATKDAVGFPYNKEMTYCKNNLVSNSSYGNSGVSVRCVLD